MAQLTLFTLPEPVPVQRCLPGLEQAPVYAGWKGVDRRAIIAPVPARQLAQWAEEDNRPRPSTYYDGKAVA